MNIFELSKQSGDSKLLSYVYAGGILKIDLELDDSEINVQLLIESDLVYFNHSLLEHPDDIKRACFIKFVESKGLLGTNNGYFIPSSDFSKVMKECGRFYNILYGSKEGFGYPFLCF